MTELSDPTTPSVLGVRVVDVVVAVVCAALGLAALAASLRERPVPEGPTAAIVDGGLALLACLALVWRRRWPVGVSLGCALGALVSFAVTPAVVVSVYTVASRRSRRVRLVVVVAVLLVQEAATVVGDVLGGSYSPPLTAAIFMATLLAAATAWGLYVGARRELVESLRERARQLVDERERDVQAARAGERTRIAQEIHDVLAHRISLISLHAGGLQVTPGLSPRAAESAALIGTTARTAMAEVRDAIGVLRRPVADGYGDVSEMPPAPQPTLAEIGELVASSADAGIPVTLDSDITPEDAALCPAGLGRHAYRLVQEGLANVAKHTDAAPTTVTLRGRPGGTLTIEVANELRSPRQRLPGGGRGLVALHERIASVGGVFRSGRESGRFVVHAEVAWP